MVSKKVVIRSLSYKDGAKGVEWSCDGSPEYEMKETDKTGRGTDIILYIDDDNKEFLEQTRIDNLLKKYCRFLPVPVISGKEQEWKDGKYVDTDKDRIINATEPLWTKKPSELTDEDYLRFYHELRPGEEDPMFLDPPKCGLSVHTYRHTVFPENKEQYRHPAQQDSALL